MTASHPSYLVQDRWIAGLDVPGDTRLHLESCAECQTRVEAARAAIPVPDWVRALDAAGAPARRARAFRPWMWAAAASALAACLAGVLLAGRPGASRQTAWTTVRGGPSVGVYVKRGATVSLWDGRAPLVPGDRVRVKVVAEGYTHVTVLAPTRAGAASLRTLHGARVDPAHETLLAPAWVVDDAPGDEVLVVVLARRAVTPAEVPAPDDASRTDLWVRWLRIPKESGDAR